MTNDRKFSRVITNLPVATAEEIKNRMETGRQVNAGGDVTIDYGILRITAPRCHLDHAIVKLRRMPKIKKIPFMRRVVWAIDRAIDAVESGDAATDEAVKMGVDIVIWYANEIIEGRKEMPP